MELQEALAQISEIRAQMARSETFRGYRSVTAGFSGALALGAAFVQGLWIPNPLAQMSEYLALWVSAAVISVMATGAEMVLRCRRADSAVTTQITRMAVLQFLPCLAAGSLLTYVMVLFARDSLWLLPGLWSVVFSLGVFASYRLLPGPIVWVGVYYMFSGIVCIALARGPAALSPWTMAGTFGVGQMLAAGILYFTLERDCE